MPHSPQERRGVRKVENSGVAFRRSFRFGASQLCGSTCDMVGVFVWYSCGVQVEKRSRVEGCDPGSSLGHAHPHGGAPTSLASANKRLGEHLPNPRSRCCCLSAVRAPVVHLLCELTAPNVMLSLHVHRPQSICLLRSPGRRRGGSKVQNSRVASIRSFRIRAFPADT